MLSFGQECGHWLKKSSCFSYYQLGEDVVELWDLEQLLNRLSSTHLLPFTGICSPCSSNENLVDHSGITHPNMFCPPEILEGIWSCLLHKDCSVKQKNS